MDEGHGADGSRLGCSTHPELRRARINGVQKNGAPVQKTAWGHITHRQEAGGSPSASSSTRQFPGSVQRSIIVTAAPWFTAILMPAGASWPARKRKPAGGFFHGRGSA
ncbi:hypothetical protein [Burkholderia metallica]|uniref:Uncharacterized protein n=1 Tax=Burkholderia metallica TaxID=488729 RepID=A0ABT8PHJ9_9BURK|nr:hypothetical protein [Burkholderia metallica]MCA7996656.1 hypothetical protein [Burkholderia metallica]MCA8022344.1 hypothetical protein [Burkholderia metallica]MDN7934489.1 hypothetical protein [Burkholderia metallica]